MDELKVDQKLIQVMHVQYSLKVSIFMSGKQLGIFQDKFLDMFIPSLKKSRIDHWKGSLW